MNYHIRKYLIFVLVIIGLVVRIYGLGFEQVSLDESFTMYHARQSVLHILTLQDPNPPLFLLLVHPLAITNNIQLARLLSVLFSVLSIPLIYLIGKHLFGEKAGLYSAVILTFSQFHIYYAQEARSYAFFNFLVMLSMFFFIKIMGNKNWTGYIISTIAMLYAHFFAIFVVIAQNIYFLIQKKRLVKWLLMQLLLFIAYIPALLLLFNQLSRVSDNFWIRKKFLIDLLYLPYIFSGGTLNFIFLALFFYGIWKIYAKGKKSPDNADLTLFWIFIPIAIPLVYSLIASPIILVPKYVIFASIPFYMLISFGLTKVNVKYGHVILMIIILLSSYSIINQALRADKERWGDLSGYINDLGINDKVIILNPGYNIHAFTYYYLPGCFNETEIYSCASESGIFTIWGEEKEKKFINNNRNIIYVNKESNEEEKDDYLEYMKGHFYIYSKESFPMGKYDHITVYWLKNEQNN